MPIYCYRNPEGQIEDFFFPMGKAPEKFKKQGRTYTRDVVAQIAGTTRESGESPEFISESRGVQPWQRQQAEDHDAKLGVPTKYTPDGRPIFNGLDHVRRWDRANNWADRNDHQGW